ncbi:MAG: protein phosphatase CheZ [Burkholderiaceae bacterium]
MSDADVDLDALFDEISTQRIEEAATVAATAAVTETAAVTDASATTEDADAVDASGKPMFERLGGIVRLLHDSLRELGFDRSLSDVASEITDAKGRLEHVATLTEQAANKVLNTIDEGMPAQDALSKSAKDIEDRWNRLYAGEMGIEEFKALAADSRRFAAETLAVSEAEKSRLLNIMMAQDFQDITGQLIKKIVSITHKAEQELAQLLKDNAPAEYRASMTVEQQDKPVELMQGPAAPGTAMEQDDVDNLLDSLGF